MIDRDKIWDLDSESLDGEEIKEILTQFDEDIISLSSDLVSISDQSNRLSVVMDVLLSILKKNVHEETWKEISNSINTAIESLDKETEEIREQMNEEKLIEHGDVGSLGKESIYKFLSPEKGQA